MIASKRAILILGLVVSAATPAFAQNQKSWVSITGSDSNDCSAGTPCATIAGAYAKTSANGEIICGTAVPFGFDLSITRGVTINCEGAPAYSFIFTTASATTTINVAADDRVVFRGIDFDFSASVTGTSPIAFNGAGTLILDHCKVSSGRAANKNGLLFRPNGPGRLEITDSLFTGAGNGSTGAGIRVVPQPGGTAQVAIKNTSISGNTFGIAIDGSASTASDGINATIVDSFMAGNIQDGIVATSSASGAPAGVTVINSQSLNNGFGIRSIGSNITVRVEGSKIIGNGTGLSGGGILLTGGGNTVQANATNGVFTGSYSQQ